MIYVLLDGVGDLPHPDLDGMTPLEAASTPNLDQLCKNGALGQVISVGRGIAPESDIAVFNMLGYKFSHSDYVGRGVIESIGVGLDFQNGHLALRGKFATMDDSGIITDRRAGRTIDREDAISISKELEEKIQFSDGVSSIMVAPTIGHRVTVVLRSDKQLSGKVTNTDPAYSNIGGMGIAKAVGDGLQIERCQPMIPEATHSALLINEFTEQSTCIMKNSSVNARRHQSSQKILSCILLRDAGSRYPVLVPIDKKYSMSFSCIVDMPVELGIAKVLKMKTFEAGDITDYTKKAQVAAEAMQTQNANYVHIKGPDEYGHDGDAKGKARNIQDIDRNFFGPLLDIIDTERVAVVVSADHATPCINKAHSDDPVPLLVSGINTKADSTSRMTEAYARQGRIGLLEGSQVLSTAIDIIRAEK